VLLSFYYTCNYNISAAILDFRLPVSSGSVTDSIIENFEPENMVVAVGILFLASLEAEIPLGIVPPFQHKRHQNNLQHMSVKHNNNNNNNNNNIIF